MSILRETSFSCLLALSLLGTAACGGDDVSPPVDSKEPDEPEPVDPDPCLLRFDTEPLRWSAVGVGYTAGQQIEFSNEGDESCSVSIAVDGDGFAAEAPSTFSVEPDATRTMAVTWSPTVVGPATGALVVTSDDLAEEVALEGEAVASCLELSPEVVDFGETVPGCSTREAKVDIENGCSHPAGIASFSFESGELNSPRSVFGIRQYSYGPFAPGTESMTLAYRPLEIGEDSEILTVVEENGAVATVALRGTGHLAAKTHDDFEQPVISRTDFLFVVDDSPAMAPYVAKLQGLTQLLVADARGRRAIARLGVTTTSRTPTTGCVHSGADGRLVPFDGSGPRWLSTDSDLPPTAFADLVDIATCSQAPNEGLSAAVRALTEPLASQADDPLHPEPEDGNLGFRRDVDLSIVFISASDDVSIDSLEDLQAALDSAGASSGSRAHALVAPAGGCDAATAGTRYATLAERTGGLIVSICDPLSTWEDELFSAGWNPMWPRPFSHVFYLTAVPQDADGDGVVADDLTVEVNGEEVAAVGEDGDVRWTFDPGASTVVFEPDHIPAEGSHIRITYFQRCD